MPRKSNQNAAILRTIRAIVGAEGMMDLYAERGGTEWCIPIECPSDHWMVRLFGEEKAEAICSHFRVFDADGRALGNVRAYVPMVNSRVAAIHEQIDEEIKQALIAGKTAIEVCREVGVSSRKVRDHIKVLRDAGVIPMPPKPHVKSSGLSKVQPPSTDRVRNRKETMSKVDGLIGAGRTNRAIMIETGASVWFVRARRKRLSWAGRLSTGGRAASDFYHKPGRSDVADHSANVGEMIPPADEVRS